MAERRGSYTGEAYLRSPIELPEGTAGGCPHEEEPPDRSMHEARVGKEAES